MIKRLTSFLIVTIFLFCITCCKVNISEEKNPFMPVIVPEMVKVSGGIINGKNNCSNLEFLNTIELVFESRVFFCQECDFCNLYKNNLTFNR